MRATAIAASQRRRERVGERVMADSTGSVAGGSPCARPSRGLDRADEVALAEFDAVVAQDVVGGRGVKEEIRQRYVGQIGKSLEAQRLVADLHLHVPLLRAGEASRKEALHVVDRPRDARLERL